MGFLQNQNTTLDLSQPEVAYWGTTQPLTPAVNNTIIVLGVLTFVLQLGLVLMFMLRCWRFDNRVRESLKHPDNVDRLIVHQFFYPDICKQSTYEICCDVATDSSPATSAAEEKHEYIMDSWCAPSIHWDLVQS